MQPCNCCFTDWIGPCGSVYETVTINTVLTPGDLYRWRIVDVQGNKFEGETIAELDGTLVIPCEELPAGLFNPYAGEFKLQILDGTHCKPISFQLTGEYDCVTFSVVGGNSQKRVIGCTPQASGASRNGIVTFTEAEEVEIDWSQFINSFGNYPTVQVYKKDDFDPNIYNLVEVQVTQVRNVTTNVLQAINIDLGGEMDGYVLING